MSLKELRKGEVYCKKDAMTGYFIVMRYNKESVTISPLLWAEEIIYQKCSIRDFKLEYKVHSGNVGRPIIEARYDHEKMRRINKL